MVMASTIAAATFVCSPASAARGTKSAIFRPRNPKFHLCSVFPQLGLSQPFSPWSGLKHLGISFTPKSLNLERKGRCKKGMVVYASLFGVGAPEALVIGVVALLVFGPKGLAEVARTLGKTLRAFQPTIRELQDVSREFKSTLEKEIGLDDLSSSSIDSNNASKMGSTSSTSPSTPTTGDSTSSSTTTTGDSTLSSIDPSSIEAYNARKMGSTTSPSTPTTGDSTSSSTATTGDSTSSSIDAYNARKMGSTTSTPPSTPTTGDSTSSSTATTGDSKTTTDPNGAPSPRAYTTEEYLKITEEQLKSVAAQKQEQTSAPADSQHEPQTPSQAPVEETATRTPSPQEPQSQT